MQSLQSLLERKKAPAVENAMYESYEQEDEDDYDLNLDKDLANIELSTSQGAFYNIDSDLTSIFGCENIVSKEKIDIRSKFNIDDSKIIEMQNKIEQLELDNVTLLEETEKITHLKRDNAKLAKELASSSEVISDLTHQLKEVKDQYQRLEQSRSMLLTKYSDGETNKDSELLKLRQSVSDMKAELIANKEDMDGLKSDLLLTRQDAKILQSEVDKLRIELESKQRECLALKEDALARRGEGDREASRWESRFNESQGDLKRLENQNRLLQSDLADAIHDVSQARTNLSISEQKLNQYEMEGQSMRRKISELDDIRSRDLSHLQGRLNAIENELQIQINENQKLRNQLQSSSMISSHSSLRDRDRDRDRGGGFHASEGEGAMGYGISGRYGNIPSSSRLDVDRDVDRDRDSLRDRDRDRVATVSWTGGGGGGSGSTAVYRDHNQNTTYEDTVASSASGSGGRGMPASSSKTRQHMAYLDTDYNSNAKAAPLGASRYDREVNSLSHYTSEPQSQSQLPSSSTKTSSGGGARSLGSLVGEAGGKAAVGSTSSQSPFATESTSDYLRSYDDLESKLTNCMSERTSLEEEIQRLNQRGAKTLKEKNRLKQADARLIELRQEITVFRKELASKPS